MIIDPVKMATPNGPTPSHPVVMDALSDATDSDLALVAMFGATSFDIFHVGDAFGERFEDGAALRQHLTSIAQDLRSEFFQRDLFGGLRPTGDRVEYTTKEQGDVMFVEVFCGRRGMLLGVDADASVPPLVDAASKLLANQV